ncbi:PAS domain-containing sensor histidine kinase [Rhodophyticola sp. CCM32]|uniref:PAS domain-containing sensor histidine kinase n=1 Tax=Rhodophyticola sp. CCM32 TaxID=2916397 RepID=UPI00107FC44B|nr:PAS domain-containing sensor histidine kinase [Rhodophyticola sp. CCM32]QBY01790.1 PAS domain-containing sensor histidine kinase [Rhodophyticola sp. CCM32]
MKRIRKISLFALVLSNTAISLGLTMLFHTWLPALTEAGPERFILLFLLTSALVALITTVSIAYAKSVEMTETSDPNLYGAFEEAIDLRENALNEHTIVSMSHADGRFKEVNENFINAFGYEPDEILGQQPSILYSDDADDHNSFDDVWEVVSQAKTWNGEQRLIAKDGRIITVQTTIIPRFDTAGVYIGSIAIRTDQTRARAEAAVEGRNAVIEGLPDGVIVYDPHTFKIIYVNRNGRTRLGWSSEDVEGRTMAETFDKFDNSLFQRYLAPLLNGEAKEVKIEVMHDAGPVEILTHFDTGPEGKPTLISVVRDIAERKQADQLKLNSVSMVSHELRTPLTSIKGALRLIESGALGELRPDILRMISVAHRNSDRLLAIVNDILALEKIDSGEMDFERETLDLRDLLHEAAESNAGYGEECGVQFVVGQMETPALVAADMPRLMQVMSNLMSNAAKFSPAGADVRLDIEDRAEAWRVCVADQGPGIPEAAHKTLFDSFFQVENTEEHSRPGTGLGLTISKKIIQRHGGTIAFETELGVGTVFYFELAKERADAAEAEGPAQSAVA